MDKEFRDLNIEIRNEDTDSFIVTGRPITYNTYSDFGGWLETIEPRSATECIKNNDVFVVFNHNNNDPLARMKNGTLKLMEDELGVYMEADFSQTPRAREVYSQIKSGLIDKMSFAFTLNPNTDVRWEAREVDGKDRKVRVIQNFERLYEVSPVLWPAYESTELQARNKEMVEKTMPKEMLNKEVKSETSTDVEEVSTDTKLKLLRYKHRL